MKKFRILKGILFGFMLMSLLVCAFGGRTAYAARNYDHIFDAKEFSGISSHEVGSNTAYVLIDGRFDNEGANTYTPYHDAVFLKGDTVIVVIASDYVLSIEKEVNDFLNALGYPHP